MKILSKASAENRVVTYRDELRAKLSPKIIDLKKDEFNDLKSSKGVPMSGLEGEILIGRHLDSSGRFRGAISIGIDTLASMLPDLKDISDFTTGWGKTLKAWRDEGIDILENVADPTPEEFELPAMEELKTVDIPAMSDFEAKQALIALQNKAKRE